MRFLVIAVLMGVGLSGCIFDSPPPPCSDKPQDYEWFLGPGYTLLVDQTPAGFEVGNGFSNAFLTNDLREWSTSPLPQGLHATGNVTIEFWARNNGQPAPVVVGGDPGEGYHFFNQFGSDRAFQPSYAIEYDDAIPTPGDIAHYVEVLPLPAGGWVFEQGDQVRLLMTSLVLDGGHDILYGGANPSSVSFTATCFDDRTWTIVGQEEHDIALATNQGLLTGAVPESENNHVVVPVTLDPATDRLTATITQTSDPNPIKDDIDFTLLVNGEAYWSGGTPYTDETMVLWEDNLAAMPAGDVAIRVDSYSGAGYEGVLRITQESSTMANS